MRLIPRDTHLWIPLILILAVAGCDETPPDPVPRTGDVAGSVLTVDGSHAVEGATVTCGGRSTEADNLGHYALTGVPTGYNVITAGKPGFYEYAAAIYVDFHTDFNIFLSKIPDFGNLFGKVVLRGSTIPVSGVTIVCEDRSTVSDDSGDFRFDGLTRGGHVVSAFKSNFIYYQTMVTLAESTQVVMLLASASLEGTVISRIDGPVAGAEVRLEMVVDTTDELGQFMMPVVPQGSHALSVSHSRYRPWAVPLSIDVAPAAVSAVLVRDVCDTIHISNDANLSLTEFEGCTDSPDWVIYDHGDDHDSRLRLQYFMRWPEIGAAPCVGRLRFLIELPDPPAYLTPPQIDSAWLHLRLTGEQTGPVVVSARRASAEAAPWSENTVAWFDSPSVSNLLYAARLLSGEDAWIIDVRSIYRDSFNPGRTLRFQREEVGIVDPPENLYLWSSEAPDPANRPFVVIHYVY